MILQIRNLKWLIKIIIQFGIKMFTIFSWLDYFLLIQIIRKVWCKIHSLQYLLAYFLYTRFIQRLLILLNWIFLILILYHCLVLTTNFQMISYFGQNRLWHNIKLQILYVCLLECLMQIYRIHLILRFLKWKFIAIIYLLSSIILVSWHRQVFT